MTKRRAAWIGVAAIGLGVTVAVGWWLFIRPAGISHDRLELIRVGMTHEDVHAILGEPSLGVALTEAGQQVASWPTVHRTVGVVVVFGPDGRVESKGLFHLPESQSSLLDRFRSWLGMSESPW